MRVRLPPVHPVIVHFPITLAATAIVGDTIGAAFGRLDINNAARWVLSGAAAAGLFAIAAGYRDMRLDALRTETHALVHLHLRVGWSAVTALVILTIWRWADTNLGPAYLVFAWLVLAVIMFQAWLGGELVYAHGAGVAAAEQGQMSPEDAKRPSVRIYGRLMGRAPGAAHAPPYTEPANQRESDND